MKGRYAPGVFVTAVLVCWAALMIAQQVPPLPRPSDLLIRPAAELQGVRRVVWDVDASRFDVDTSGQGTAVFAAWAGDMRLSMRWRSVGMPTLVFERDGDTVYVRAQATLQQQGQDWAGEDARSSRRQELRSRSVTLPASLTLPAGVEEIVWPKLHLQVAQNALAPLPRLTVRAHDVQIGGDERMYLDDPLLSGMQKGDRIPGRVQRLQIFSTLAPAPCSSGGQTRWQSGSLSYEGGFFDELMLVAQGGDIRIAALDPDLHAQVFLSPATGLNVREYRYLSAIRVQPLSDAQRAQLQPVASTTPRRGPNCAD